MIFLWVFVAIFQPYPVLDFFALLKNFWRKLARVWITLSVIFLRISVFRVFRHTLAIPLWTDGRIWLRNIDYWLVITLFITIRIVKIWLFGRTIVIWVWSKSVLILVDTAGTGSMSERNKVLSIFVEKSNGFVLKQPIQLKLEDFVIILQLLGWFKLFVGLLQE